MAINYAALNKALLVALHEDCFAAWEVIVRTYLRFAYRRAYDMSRNEKLTPEIVRQGFRNLWVHRHKIPQGASLIAYLNFYIQMAHADLILAKAV